MGSEMCIRDSEDGVDHRHHVQREQGGHQDAAGDGVPERAASWCCLLYTSDAADERSSVDLGGRRIIKKKTPTTTHEARYIEISYDARYGIQET